MYKLYEFPSSGNCYKLRLAMSQLNVDYERIPIDVTRGESRTEAFLRINPNGRVPVLQVSEGVSLPESNAALWYLACDTPLCPTSKLEQAQVLQWMFFEQYSHEPFIATSRYWISILKAADAYREQLEEKRPKGYAALDVMEQHLAHNSFFVGDAYSIADIALYGYTHVAHEGGFDLQAYPAIRGWLERILRSQNYIPISH
ncbi:Disulfide-bond oxidoreductase YfcG [Acaryochloris thomasi RCC1774]|uniref:Disulfide-bond oxidoreductase YfcG n=1 Tax=Acaryochloris thomasi RCC1774 TaxID=1764569 RepID=A0A2W1JD37_9CYAN|nr:glutathione S-transferase family protein [Acaryochloris thomasi]PZD71813.1 Disulfide-bond oxidoreductase YfcG [Acaryochloris thomasi RCC1774]